MLTALERKVIDRVGDSADEMIEFARDLVRIPTVNPPGEFYADCAGLIGTRLSDFGYDVRYIAAQGLPECTEKFPRINVMGRMEGARARPALHFNGHLDVVPAGAGWTVDPFAAVMRDGRIYGRGVTDQKAGIAASIYAVEAIRRAGITLDGPVEQSATADEESGGAAGVEYLARRGYLDRRSIDFAVITEPLNFDRICLGHRGVYWFEIALRGKIAHGSMPFLGINAIDLMGRFIHLIDTELKPKLQARRTNMPVEPPEARSASININAIFGGQQMNSLQTPCVADLCRAIFDRRFLIEENFDDVQNEILSILEGMRDETSAWDYDLHDLMIVLPTMTDPESDLVRIMASSIESAIGTTPPMIASPGTYDQKHFARIAGIRQCIAYGPGILDLAHQPDEYCETAHLIKACQAMAVATMRLLGVAEAKDR